jgi:hypothetical protein
MHLFRESDESCVVNVPVATSSDNGDLRAYPAQASKHTL